MNLCRPAFPTPEFFDEKLIGSRDGMTLRDYFAASALQPILADMVRDGHASEPQHADVAAGAAYLVADAMMNARVK